MTSVLDAILDGAKVVSEEHDLSKAIPAGPQWDAAEYSATAEQAVRRANLGKANGKVTLAVAGQTPWHGLGVVLDRPMSGTEAMQFASLGWTVEKVELKLPNGEASKFAYSIVRSDTQRELGTVGSIYEPFQNADLFEFADGVVAGGARFESAGALGGGETVFALAYMPESAFSVTDGDEILPYILLSNSHNGTSAIKVITTATRVVCQNTHNTAMRGRAKGISIRHTKNAKQRVEQAQRALGLAQESVECYAKQARKLASVELTGDAYDRYLEQSLDAMVSLNSVIQVTQAECDKGAGALDRILAIADADERDKAAKAVEKQIRKRQGIVSDILERWESDRCPSNAWGAYNSISEWVDHGDGFRYLGDSQAKREARFMSIMDGRQEAVKQVAFDNALALAK